MLVDDSLNLSNGIIAEVGYILKDIPGICTLFFLPPACNRLSVLYLLPADKADSPYRPRTITGRSTIGSSHRIFLNIFGFPNHHRPSRKPPLVLTIDIRKNHPNHGAFSGIRSRCKSAAGQSHHYPLYMEIWENGFAEDSIRLLTLLKRVVFC